MPPAAVTDLRGGRNGIDSPIDPTFPTNQCAEAWNVDFADGPLGRRRGGATALSTAGGTAFTSAINALARWVPAGDETLAELWAVDGAAVPVVKRLAAGVAWANVTLADPIASSPYQVRFCALNGKLYIGYDAGAAIDRLHCYDPNLAVPKVRRVGINPGAVAPTVANQGSGSLAATPRFYRVRFLQVVSGAIIRRSEPTPASLSFSPSGSGLSARVTQPAPPGEDETHWEIDASSNNTTWSKLVSFEQATHIAIATTTYDDTVAPTAYGSLPVADLIGYYTLPPSARFIVSDANRLIMAGHWAASTWTSRIWFTPVLGSTDKGDDERLRQTATLKPFLDLNEKDGGEITGLSDPAGGILYAFKYRRCIRLTPTGDDVVPYSVREVSHVVGSLNHEGIVVAEDSAGNPATYWMSHKGPYRVGTNGLEYLGRDIEDIWRGLNGQSAVNLDATIKVCHGKYYPLLGQIWWWVATGASNTPNLKLVLDIKNASRVDRFGVRGGWSVHDGPSAAAMCSEVFATTVAASMSKQLQPYVGLAGSAVIYKCDSTATDDAGTGYQAYIKTRSLIASSQVGNLVSIGTTADCLLLARAVNAEIQITITKDFGASQSNDDVNLAPNGSETRIVRKFGGAMESDLGVVQLTLGDKQACSTPQWSLEGLIIPVNFDGDI